MKNFLSLFSLLFLCIFISSCSTDDECSQADWIGTYTIVGEDECEIDSMSSIVFNESIVMAAGGTENSINWDGDDIVFTDCSVTDLITLTLNGDMITATLGECTAEYQRN